MEVTIGWDRDEESLSVPRQERAPLRLVHGAGDAEKNGTSGSPEVSEVFVAQLATYEAKVRMALMAHYGPDLMDELTAECMAWAWENQERLASIENPIGYLIRVGQSRSRRLLRWRRERTRYPVVHATTEETWVEPALPKALSRLDDETRSAVILVHCFQWTYGEVAELLDLPLHTVRNRIHRGLHKLRDDLGATNG